MKIMVTGVAGFIGHHYGDALVGLGIYLIFLECLTFELKTSSLNIEKIKFYEINMHEKEKLEICWENKVDTVVNLAAEITENQTCLSSLHIVFGKFMF